jgi:hypothetical protein
MRTSALMLPITNAWRSGTVRPARAGNEVGRASQLVTLAQLLVMATRPAR